MMPHQSVASIDGRVEGMPTQSCIRGHDSVPLLGVAHSSVTHKYMQQVIIQTLPHIQLNNAVWY